MMSYFGAYTFFFLLKNYTGDLGQCKFKKVLFKINPTSKGSCENKANTYVKLYNRLSKKRELENPFHSLFEPLLSEKNIITNKGRYIVQRQHVI